MEKLYFFILFAFCIQLYATAQTNSTATPYVQIINGKYHYNNSQIAYKDLKEKFKDLQPFYQESRRATALSTGGDILGGMSLGIFAIGVGSALNCEDLGCLGSAAIIGLSFPFGIVGTILKLTSKSKKDRSIQMLNYGLHKQLEENDLSLNLKLSGSGIGLIVVF